MDPAGCQNLDLLLETEQLVVTEMNLMDIIGHLTEVVLNVGHTTPQGATGTSVPE